MQGVPAPAWTGEARPPNRVEPALPPGPPSGPLSGRPSAPYGAEGLYGGSGGAGAPARHRVGLLRLAVAVVSLVLVAGGVWWLALH